MSFGLLQCIVLNGDIELPPFSTPFVVYIRGANVEDNAITVVNANVLELFGSSTHSLLALIA